MDIRTLDDAEIAKVLATPESHFLDFKSKDISPSKLSKTLAAFGNADGGEIYIGIEDEKVTSDRRRGYPQPEDANGLLQVLNSKFPIGPSFQYEFLVNSKRAGLVVRIEIFKNSTLWTDTSGDVYVRRGAQGLKVSELDAIRRIEFAKGLASFEDEMLPVDATFLDEFAVLVKFVSQIVPAAVSGPWLEKQRLVISKSVTVAGAVLFSKEPQVLLPKAAIKVYRYKTSDNASRETLENQPETIEGCAYDQIHQAVKRVVEIVENIPIMKDSGFETIVYPDNALHEIITNAVIHRDYSISDDVHVVVFNNRIEITSPGRLPAHITTHNILTERYARNQKIVRILNKFPDPPNKDVGEGLNTAFEAMRGLNLKAPEIQESDARVIVTLRHERLAQPETVIVDYLRNNPEINNAKAREITHTGSEAKITKIFSKLKKNGIVERTSATLKVKAAYTRGKNFPE